MILLYHTDRGTQAWYIKLDEEVQGSWRKLRIAMMEEFSTPTAPIATSTSSLLNETHASSSQVPPPSYSLEDMGGEYNEDSFGEFFFIIPCACIQNEMRCHSL